MDLVQLDYTLSLSFKGGSFQEGKEQGLGNLGSSGCQGQARSRHFAAAA